jgi:hypothetical protein
VDGLALVHLVLEVVDLGLVLVHRQDARTDAVTTEVTIETERDAIKTPANLSKFYQMETLYCHFELKISK